MRRHFYDVSRTDKSGETESKLVFARGWGHQEVMAKKSGFFCGGDKTVSKLIVMMAAQR